MTRVRRLAVAPLAVALLAPTIAQAQDAAEESATGWSHTFELSVVSDYVFRGVSNSNEEVAYQPGYTAAYTTPGGAEVNFGIWGSTLDPDNTVLEQEVDYWTGVYWSTDHYDFGVAYTYYTYPGSPQDTDLAFSEVQFTAGRAVGSVYLSAEYDFSPDFYSTGESHYGRIGVGSGEGVLPAGLSLFGHVGYQSFDDNALYGTPDYFDGGVKLSATWNWLTAGVEWTTTDIDNADCFGGLSVCEDRVFATLTAAFSP